MIYSIIFDWKRTLYDPDNDVLIKGTIDLLTYLKNNKIRLILIGKGGPEMHDAVSRLNVKDYFSEIIFQEGKKSKEQFLQFIDPSQSKNTIFIGDRVKSELLLGNQLGATTIWVQSGKFANELPGGDAEQPSYTVKDLHQCKNLIRKEIKILPV